MKQMKLEQDPISLNDRISEFSINQGTDIETNDENISNSKVTFNDCHVILQSLEAISSSIHEYSKSMERLQELLQEGKLIQNSIQYKTQQYIDETKTHHEHFRKARFVSFLIR